MTCKERFMRYIAVSTASDEDSTESPSTARQMDLGRILAAEMKELGLKDIRTDQCGNVIGTLPASEGASAPAVAFIAHMDTSPAASGENVRAREVLFTGEDVDLGHGEVLSETQFPFLKELRGKTLLVTDGSTLLGADDKAGVAEIMTMAEKLIESGTPHGELRLVFTTDEEVGRGTEGLDVAELACAFGYTVDGGPIGSVEYENFNAASARVKIHGVGIHPGGAKGIMKNAAAIAAEFHMLLPGDQVPEKTEGYEGFIHLTDLHGDVTEAELRYIIRDHDEALFEEKKKTVLTAAETIVARYGSDVIDVEIRDTYYNMKKKVEPYPHLIERVRDAFAAEGIAFRAEPIRGGTDGAVLSWMGLPCPNLSTGGYNFHGVHEFIPTDSLERMPDVLVRLACSFEDKGTEARNAK